jgi:hypothetical protein
LEYPATAALVALLEATTHEALKMSARRGSLAGFFAILVWAAFRYVFLSAVFDQDSDESIVVNPVKFPFAVPD